MILHLNSDTTRVALNILHWPTSRHISDWRNLSLVITPGQDDNCSCCHTGGSPWYLWGCWPGKPTGVDVANPPKPDFPPFYIDAHEYDNKGMVVFILPERWKQIAYGRYTGRIVYNDHTVPVLPFIPLPETFKPQPPDLYPYNSCSTPPSVPKPCPLPPPPPPCVLAKFDIDYGYKCSEHIIQEAAIKLALSTCEEDV